MMKRMAVMLLLLLTSFFTVWVAIGVSMLWLHPDRRDRDIVLILALLGGLAALSFWAAARLRR
jgi:hypothetical protein